MSDQLVDGRRFRILTVLDNYTRECLALRLVEERERPDYIQGDNGSLGLASQCPY